MEQHKKIPYAITNFDSIRKENYLYVEKTRFIHPTSKRNGYFVMKFNFSELDTSNNESFGMGLGAQIRDATRRQKEKYHQSAPK